MIENNGESTPRTLVSGFGQLSGRVEKERSAVGCGGSWGFRLFFFAIAVP